MRDNFSPIGLVRHPLTLEKKLLALFQRTNDIDMNMMTYQQLLYTYMYSLDAFLFCTSETTVL